MAIDYAKIFYDTDGLMRNLTKEEKGKILWSMVIYYKDGTEPNLTGKANSIWPMIKADIDRDIKARNAPNKTEGEPNETGGEPNESERNRNDQDYIYNYDYLVDEDVRAYARQARINETYIQFIGRMPRPGEVSPLANYAFFERFEPGTLAFAIEVSASADNPCAYAMSVLNTWSLRDALPFYAERIRKKIMDLVDEYREKLFYRLIETGVITVEPTWSFPQLITPVPTMLPLDKALYTDEGEVNHFELKVIKYIASLDNVVWWHRNIERRGFCLNGFINHYPDFIVKTTRGNIVLVETKGDDRDNSDSKQKLSLGTKWADMAGSQYRYYMVFDEADIGVPGAYRFTEFGELIKHL